MMDPSISPRFVIGRVNRSLLRPPNSPFLSAFFVSKAQIPPSKAVRFGLVYSSGVTLQTVWIQMGLMDWILMWSVFGRVEMCYIS